MFFSITKGGFKSESRSGFSNCPKWEKWPLLKWVPKTILRALRIFFFRLFFGRIENSKNCFRDLLTFTQCHFMENSSWFILLKIFWKHFFNCYRCMEKPVSNWFARSWTSWVQLVLTINSLTLVQALVKLSSRWQHWQIVKWLLELKKQPPLPIMPR